MPSIKLLICICVFLVYKEFAAFSLRLLQKNEGEIFNDFMSKRS